MMRDFYRGKKVFITGSTGFKGSWMCAVLLSMGAKIVGYGLRPVTESNLYDLLALESRMNTVIGDIRNLEKINSIVAREQPEIIIHMAAQPLVRESYVNPVYTYDVNVMGTVNILESIRRNSCVKSFVNVTTDKVYKNREWEWGYRENEELNGYDPYSNSKSCSELITDSYRNSFFKGRNVAISTARAGNVIGGGDFASDRIIPDCIRAALKEEEIIIRNPYSVRPYQHVLEPIMAYLLLAKGQYENPALAGSYNIGPEEKDCITTGELTDIFCSKWKELTGKKLFWINKYDGGPHEANYLKLDCSKIKSCLHWKPVWGIENAVYKTIEVYIASSSGKLGECVDRQIKEYTENIRKK